MADEERYKILAELARHTGKIVSSSFLRETSQFIPWIERFHYLISGIYKPAGSRYALSIVMKQGSPYAEKDDVVFLSDGRWLMEYSPRAGGLKIADNIALMNCKNEAMPLGVFLQITDKSIRHGSTYRVLGLGVISEYDAQRDVFVIESISASRLDQVTNFIEDEAIRYETQIYAQVANQFHPFVKDEKKAYFVNLTKRDEAFRRVVLHEYQYSCVLCQMLFKLGDLAEATAAHIVPKHKSGTDDPRNGLSLCRTHHWAFDEGLFTVSDEYTVIISPVLNKAKHHHFPLLEFDQQKILAPQDKRIAPNTVALQWHRENILRTA